MSAWSDFDWNLLKCLDALLKAQNVTRAATRLGMSQPAMSRALARLRQVFDDELFVRGPAGMEPTERARELAGMLETIQHEVGRAVATPHFDPARAERTFVLAGADFAEFALIPGLVRLWQSRAPGLDVRFVRASADAEVLLADPEIDLLIVPRLSKQLGSVLGQKLFDEGFACITRRNHPGVKGRLTLKRYCSLPHLLVAPRGRPGGIVDRQLAQRGRTRRIALQVPTFLAAPPIIAETDLIATLPRRLVQAFQNWLPLQVHEPPLEIPGFTSMQYWSARRGADPAHAYLRRSLLEVAQAPNGSTGTI